MSLSTTSLNCFKSTRTGFNLSTSNLYTLFFKLSKPLCTLFSLSTFNLSISDLKLAKSVFLAKSDIQHFLYFLSQILLYN